MHVYSHTHWDYEWYFTASESIIQLIYHMDEVISALESGTLKTYLLDSQVSILEEYLHIMLSLIHILFSAALKTHNALEKGILTGCLRIAKESTPQAGFSLFTGLNNFKVLSIFDETSKQRFGFTQNEIDSLLLDYQANEYQGQVKEW